MTGPGRVQGGEATRAVERVSSRRRCDETASLDKESAQPLSHATSARSAVYNSNAPPLVPPPPLASGVRAQLEVQITLKPVRSRHDLIASLQNRAFASWEEILHGRRRSSGLPLHRIQHDLPLLLSQLGQQLLDRDGSSERSHLGPRLAHEPHELVAVASERRRERGELEVQEGAAHGVFEEVRLGVCRCVRCRVTAAWRRGERVAERVGLTRRGGRSVQGEARQASQSCTAGLRFARASAIARPAPFETKEPESRTSELVLPIRQRRPLQRPLEQQVPHARKQRRVAFVVLAVARLAHHVVRDLAVELVERGLVWFRRVGRAGRGGSMRVAGKVRLRGERRGRDAPATTCTR